jgi:hypothetical protein
MHSSLPLPRVLELLDVVQPQDLTRALWACGEVSTWRGLPPVCLSRRMPRLMHEVSTLQRCITHCHSSHTWTHLPVPWLLPGIPGLYDITLVHS